MSPWCKRVVTAPLRLDGVALLCGAMLLSACAVGPDFKRPHPATPATWVGASVAAPASQATANPVTASPWWQSFQDPTLSALVERAIQSNDTLRDAFLRIAAARAQRDIAAAGLWPSISGNASFARQRISENTSTGALFNGQGAAPGFALPGVANPFNQWGLAFDAAWEVDLFGRVRRSIEAADADSLSSIEDERDVRLTVIGDVTRAYIELRGEQLRLSISELNLASQREVLELTRDRQRAGVGNDLDVANAAAQVASTEALLPDLRRLIDQSINQLSLLLSREPAALRDELGEARQVPGPPPEVPTGLPADIVRRRPDIRRAEAALHAATARVGVAEADLFPRLTLSVGAGFQAQDLKNLADWASRFATLGPRLDVPIFEGGRRRATLTLQKVSEQRSALAYQHTVLAALHEVENSLTAFGAEQARHVALETAVTESRDALSLSRLRYKSGVISFLEVLDAERNLQQAELALAQSTTTVSTNLVALYKALGGGWDGVTTVPAPRS